MSIELCGGIGLVYETTTCMFCVITNHQVSGVVYSVL